VKQLLSPQNPFAEIIGGVPNWGQAFLWENLNHWKNQRDALPYLADYGTYDAKMLKSILASGVIERAEGFELNKDIIEANKKLIPNQIEITLVTKNPTFYNKENTFDFISMISVLEHIHDQAHILNELNRVLKVGGFLVIQVPGSHFFSFLDFGNWKFVFPAFHRIYYQTRYSKKLYKERYIECVNGMVGDIEKEKAWHQHFNHQELESLLESHNFKVVKQDGFGLFYRLFHNVRYLFPKPIKSFWNPLILWDAKNFGQAEIFVVAQKVK
jgi:SAM-dependent methyltransferase